MMIEITPIEFDEQDYAKREDCVVWYKDEIVQWVERVSKRDSRYSLHCIQETESTLVASVSGYDVCLLVESVDHAVFRRQCHELVDQLPDDALLSNLAELKREVAWQNEIKEYKAQRKP